VPVACTKPARAVAVQPNASGVSHGAELHSHCSPRNNDSLCASLPIVVGHYLSGRWTILPYLSDCTLSAVPRHKKPHDCMVCGYAPCAEEL
jgi:hypothetical protein